MPTASHCQFLDPSIDLPFGATHLFCRRGASHIPLAERPPGDGFLGTDKTSPCYSRKPHQHKSTCRRQIPHDWATTRSTRGKRPLHIRNNEVRISWQVSHRRRKSLSLNGMIPSIHVAIEANQEGYADLRLPGDGAQASRHRLTNEERRNEDIRPAYPPLQTRSSTTTAVRVGGCQTWAKRTGLCIGLRSIPKPRGHANRQFRGICRCSTRVQTRSRPGPRRCARR
jgi:hypothetical protein